MAICSSCSAELRPEWKFCVKCGTPVIEVTRAIPSAIRPEPQRNLEIDGEPATGSGRPRLALYAPLAFSVLCFLAAGAVIALLAVNVWF